jgi:hypothetical protein
MSDGTARGSNSCVFLCVCLCLCMFMHVHLGACLQLAERYASMQACRNEYLFGGEWVGRWVCAVLCLPRCVGMCHETVVFAAMLSGQSAL